MKNESDNKIYSKTFANNNILKSELNNSDSGWKAILKNYQDGFYLIEYSQNSLLLTKKIYLIKSDKAESQAKKGGVFLGIEKLTFIMYDDTQFIKNGVRNFGGNKLQDLKLKLPKENYYNLIALTQDPDWNKESAQHGIGKSLLETQVRIDQLQDGSGIDFGSFLTGTSVSGVPDTRVWAATTYKPPYLNGCWGRSDLGYDTAENLFIAGSSTSMEKLEEANITTPEQSGVYYQYKAYVKDVDEVDGQPVVSGPAEALDSLKTLQNGGSVLAKSGPTKTIKNADNIVISIYIPKGSQGPESANMVRMIVFDSKGIGRELNYSYRSKLGDLNNYDNSNNQAMHLWYSHTWLVGGKLTTEFPGYVGYSIKNLSIWFTDTTIDNFTYKKGNAYRLLDQEKASSYLYAIIPSIKDIILSIPNYKFLQGPSPDPGPDPVPVPGNPPSVKRNNFMLIFIILVFLMFIIKKKMSKK